jgi:SAM-dependent methyltransferase
MPGYILKKHLPFGNNFKALHENSKTIVDIGSGGDPYEYATILVDKYVEDNYQRGVNLKVSEGKTFINADIIDLPFGDKEIDFVFCKFIFEHVHEPDKACSEIIRVGNAGLIITPTALWETLFTRPKDKHMWIVGCEGETLTFTPNRCEQFANGYFDRLFASKTQEANDFKHIFWQNYDRFINCYYWQNNFSWEVKT